LNQFGVIPHILKVFQEINALFFSLSVNSLNFGYAVNLEEQVAANKVVEAEYSRQVSQYDEVFGTRIVLSPEPGDLW
jgi:hypothetical protein